MNSWATSTPPTDAKCFQLSKDTRRRVLRGPGHGTLLGRQFSIVTDEPFFRDFNMVMEGNNEVDIDGRERAARLSRHRRLVHVQLGIPGDVRRPAGGHAVRRTRFDVAGSRSTASTTISRSGSIGSCTW